MGTMHGSDLGISLHHFLLRVDKDARSPLPRLSGEDERPRSRPVFVVDLVVSHFQNGRIEVFAVNWERFQESADSFRKRTPRVVYSCDFVRVSVSQPFFMLESRFTCERQLLPTLPFPAAAAGFLPNLVNLVWSLFGTFPRFALLSPPSRSIKPVRSVNLV